MLNAQEAGTRTRKAVIAAKERLAKNDRHFMQANADAISAMLDLTLRLIEKHIKEASDRCESNTVFRVAYQDKDEHSKCNRMLLAAAKLAQDELMGWGYIVREIGDPDRLFTIQISWHMHV